MLAENHICKVQSQNFATMEQQYFRKYGASKNTQLIITLRDMFSSNQKMTELFASEAFHALKGKCNLSEDSYAAYFEQLATYGVMMSNLVFGYNPSAETLDKKLSLYTTSMTVLKQLANQGVLKGKKNPIEVELPEIEKTIYGSDRIKKSFKDGKKIVTVRLDGEMVGTDKVIFKPTIPKSAPEIGSIYFIPYATLLTAQQLLEEWLRSSTLRINMDGKVRDVTLNEGVLRAIYGDARTPLLLRRNIDIRMGRFYVPCIGASIYSSGLTNIHMTEVDSIQVIENISQLNLSQVNLNMAQVKPYMMKILKSQELEFINSIATELGLETAKTKKDVLKNIEVGIHDQKDHELYNYMKTHDDIFKTADYANVPCKYGKDFIPLTVPNTVEELRELLNAGVFKVLAVKRDGSFTTIIGSNNQREIKRILGKSYVKYESEGVRLRAFKDDLKDQGGDGEIGNEGLMLLAKEYGVESIVFGTEDLKSVKKDGNTKIADVVGRVDQGLMSVEMRKTVVQQPHLVTIRNLEATMDADGQPIGFYKNLDVSSIVDITCLHKYRK